MSEALDLDVRNALGDEGGPGAELPALRLENARLRAGLRAARRAMVREVRELRCTDAGHREYDSAHRLELSREAVDAVLAAPPPALEELRELVAAVKVEIDEWIESGDGEGGPGYPPERLGAAYAAVLAAYPYLGRA